MKTGRPKKYQDKKRIALDVDAEIYDFIIQAAKMQGKTTRDFVIEEILLKVQGCYITCPSCKRPVIDRRTILDDEIHIQCHNCKHEWRWKVDETLPDSDKHL